MGDARARGGVSDTGSATDESGQARSVAQGLRGAHSFFVLLLFSMLMAISTGPRVYCARADTQTVDYRLVGSGC
jgi:hypothetical protein